MGKRVKKGSSLIMIIVLMGIISVLGLSLSTLAVTTYKSRIVNSTSKINLYAAEAGIDEVYGIIGSTVDKGINYANEQVAAIDLEQAKIDKISNLFTAYPNFYELEGSQSILNNLNETINPSGIPLVVLDVAQLFLDDNGQVSASINESRLKDYQNQQFQYYYKEYINNGKSSIDGEIVEQKLAIALTDTARYKFALSGESNKPEITLLNNTPFSMDVGNNTPYKIKAQSEFLDSREGIRKAIEMEYELEVPEYSDVYYMKNIKFPKNVVWEKAIAADGDMNVDASKVTINGEVYVKGTNEGGVNLIGNNSSVTLQKKLATRQNINLKAQNSLFTSNENIYANNVIIYKDDSNDANGSNFNITNAEAALYLRDDLELNADNSKINIAGGFYGLYDGPDEIGNTSFLGNDHSSSVVINSDDIETGGSSLNIAGNVIIQGTAYINTNPEYQTGESISIKGNYKAYTRGLTIDSAISRGKSLKSDNVIFEYREPLSVVSQFLDGTPLLAPDKSKYFEAYNDEFRDSTEESDRLRTSGVNIAGNIIATAGSIIHNGNIIESQLTPDEDKIKEKTRELKRNIFYMGDTTPTDQEVFHETEVQRDVSSLVNYDMLIEKTKAPISNDISESEEVVVLDGNSTNNYAFIGESGTTPINANKVYNIVNNNFKGIIVTAGDVYLSGKLNFSGTIITKGNIIFLGSDEKNISYNPKLVKRLVAENYEIFIPDDKNLVNYNEKLVIYDEMGKEPIIGTDMLKNKIIKRKNWKILK